MSKKKPQTKKVVKTVQKTSPKKKVTPTTSKKTRASKPAADAPAAELLFGKENYKWMLIGLLVIMAGFALMAGGNNAPDEWDVNKIYAFRRITLAPMVVLAGLGIEIYAIFKR